MRVTIICVASMVVSDLPAIPLTTNQTTNQPIIPQLTTHASVLIVDHRVAILLTVQCKKIALTAYPNIQPNQTQHPDATRFKDRTTSSQHEQAHHTRIQYIRILAHPPSRTSKAHATPNKKIAKRRSRSPLLLPSFSPSPSPSPKRENGRISVHHATSLTDLADLSLPQSRANRQKN